MKLGYPTTPFSESPTPEEGYQSWFSSGLSPSADMDHGSGDS